MTFNTPGIYTVTLFADPSAMTGDIDLTDNYQSMIQSVTQGSTGGFDGCRFKAKWASAPTLVTRIDNSTLTATTSDKLSTAIGKWNGLSGVSAGQIVTSGGNVRCYAEDLAGPVYSFHGYTNLYNGDALINYPESTSATITRAVAALEQSYEASERTIIHEYGHVLGLCHPTCNELSVMHLQDNPKWTNYITDHDKYSLAQHYA